VRQKEPAARSDAVRLVVEALGEGVRKVPHGHRAQQRGVDRRHAVRAVRANDGEVGHTHMLRRAFLDQARTGDAAAVPREAAPAKRRRTSSVNRLLISKMISRWRGSIFSNQARGHFSSASGKSVWFVYASVRWVKSQAWSHPRCASSRRIRISSGTAMAGWV